MKLNVVSFNVNSIRVRLHQLQTVIDKYQPDIIGLQETKVTDEDFPLQEVNDLGYDVTYFGQKTHYGVALLSKSPLLNISKGFKGAPEDQQRRFIAGDYALGDKLIRVANGYFPQGESRSHPTKFPAKAKFYAGLSRYLENQCSADQPTIVMGDMNVAPLDLDIGIGEPNMKRWLRDGKTSFLPEEREWLEKIVDWGLFDTYRHLHPEVGDLFSWFDYRSKGFEREPKRGLRIDLILASQSLKSQCTDAGIDYEVRGMTKPSDHCPIFASFELD